MAEYAKDQEIKQTKIAVSNCLKNSEIIESYYISANKFCKNPN